MGRLLSKSLVRTSLTLLFCIPAKKKREREFLSFVRSYLVYYSFFVDTRGEHDSLRFLCQRTVVSTTVFASPTYFCARARSRLILLTRVSASFFLAPLFILVGHLVTTRPTRSPSRSRYSAIVSRIIHSILLDKSFR